MGSRKPTSKGSLSSPTVPEGLMKIHIEMAHHVFDLDLAEQVKIPLDFKGLCVAMSEYSGHLGTWVMMEQIARQILDQLEANLEILEAELQGEVRARLEAAGVKATVKDIEARIILDEKRIELSQKILKAKHDLGLIVAGRQAIYSKKDCMLALGSNYRAEMTTLLGVKGQVDRAKFDLEELYKRRGE